MENYKKKYKDALERASKLRVQNPFDTVSQMMEYVFPELQDKNEKIRNVFRGWIYTRPDSFFDNGISKEEMLTWLEKQGEHKLPIEKLPSEIKTPEESLGIDSDTYSKIVDECVYGEQKCVNNVKPKFHKGNWVTNGIDCTFQIASIEDGIYYDTNNCGSDIKSTDKSYHLWTIKDAKDGDVLASDNGVIILVKESRDSSFGYRLSYHCAILYDGTFEPKEFHVNPEKFFPATKEQRNTLFVKMKEAGYEWDAEKKELKKIDDEEYNGEDYGIDSLFHAQRILEKTLGKVDGYQSDDGILSHKCAITAVKKLYKQKLAWSDEAEEMLDNAIFACISTYGKDSDSAVWLKSLKQRIGE